MKYDRAVSCVFCDDIRFEIGNKFSLIGCYSGEMHVPLSQFPLIIPKLGIHVWVSTPITKPFKTISSQIFEPSGQEIARIEPADVSKMVQKQHDSTKFMAGMMALLSPVQITREGFLEVWVEADGEKERAGRLLISLNPQMVPTPDEAQT